MKFDAVITGTVQKMQTKKMPAYTGNREDLTQASIFANVRNANGDQKVFQINSYYAVGNFNTNKLKTVREDQQALIYCFLKPKLKKITRGPDKLEWIRIDLRYGWHKQLTKEDQNMKEQSQFHICGRILNYKKLSFTKFSYYEVMIIKNYGEKFQETYTVSRFYKDEEEADKIGQELQQMVQANQEYHCLGTIAASWKTNDRGMEIQNVRLTAKAFYPEGDVEKSQLLKDRYFDCEEADGARKKKLAVKETFQKGKGNNVEVVEEEEEMPF